MPIVIKEIIVKTTVERSAPRDSASDERLVEEVKRKVLEELGEESRRQGTRKDRKDR